MSTSTRRTSTGRLAGAAASAPFWNAALLTVALTAALWLLVQRGRLAWPPSELLASTWTVAGCLALVGPIVLARRDGAECGLGDLLWMTGGLLLWIYDAAALLRGTAPGHSWTTPMAMAPMGLAILAVLVAGWRLQVASSRSWTWTNVTGWILGVYWVGMGLYALAPASAPGLALR